uniref:hypothetical protein n=1 Tax=Vibrio harveyi TaxID=669 RepID=UPI0018F238A3
WQGLVGSEMCIRDRSNTAVQTPASQSPDNAALDYFKSAISDEIRYVSEQKAAGRGIVGFYCEFTPRDLILAADAVPICLCGTSQNTISLSLIHI